MQFTQKGIQVILAIQAKNRDPNITARVVAMTYNISLTTLTRGLKRTASRRDAMPNCWNLTDLEESTIIQYVLDLDWRSFPPGLRGVKDIANRLLADRERASCRNQLGFKVR